MTDVNNPAHRHQAEAMDFIEKCETDSLPEDLSLWNRISEDHDRQEPTYVLR